MGLNLVAGVLIRRRTFGQRKTQGEHCAMSEAGIAVMPCKPRSYHRSAADPRGWEGGPDRFSLRVSVRVNPANEPPEL